MNATITRNVRRLAVVGLFLMMWVPGCQKPLRGPGHVTTGIRAIWVTRWDFKTEADVEAVIENCYRGGFNTVLFQVRGNGTAFYGSRLEPWADELGGSDPGFDPLAVAVRVAHRRGMELHAWVNVMPAWRGKAPPSDPRQLYHTRPDWFLRDADGRRQPLGWYNSLNPCYPEVRHYLVAVMREVLTHYNVDGLHLDYIRFPNEWVESYAPATAVPDYPRDARTLALFHRDTRFTPEQSPSAWTQWRADQVTQLVRDIRSMMKDVKPRVRLSAAVGAEPEKAYQHHYQDGRRWIEEGLLDAVYPMNYTKDLSTFSDRVATWAHYGVRTAVVMGVQFDRRPGQLVLEQIRRSRARTPHFAVFAYNSLFDRRHEKPDLADASGRAARREDTLPFIRFCAQQARLVKH